MRNGDSIRYLTTCNVADYLIKNDLYNEESEKKERISYHFFTFIAQVRLGLLDIDLIICDKRILILF